MGIIIYFYFLEEEALARPIQRVSKSYVRIREHLYNNEARCSRHVGIILSAYATHKPHKPFPEVLRRYGITPETVQYSELLKLCLEWRDNDDTEMKVTFFNTKGKGDVLERLLQEYCPDLASLYPIEATMEKRRAVKRDKKRKKVSLASTS
jgi:hypothetical protein